MTSYLRRKVLIERMQELEASGSSCSGCQGTCCTYEANSMMTTPLETLELLLYLKSTAQQNHELKEKLQETVKKYRLDFSSGNGRRSFIRRTYTCPFFNHRELGCPLPREIKPYGCLAFNSHHPELKAQEHCYSETPLLRQREEQSLGEKELNQKIKSRYQLTWEKLPLPLALLECWDKDFSIADLE